MEEKILLIEIIKFILYSSLIVIISKYFLSENLRKLSDCLKLKSKTVGNVAGFTTSVPELLTITISSVRGLFGASLYNIISSNVINIMQYFVSIILNKNFSKLKNKAIKIDIILAGITILIPLILLIFDINLDMGITPLFIILFIFFRFLNNNTHKI